MSYSFQIFIISFVVILCIFMIIFLIRNTKDNVSHCPCLREVHEEATLAREKASDLKIRREEQAAARREKLKQAYLRKQLEKLKASSKTG